MPKDYAVAFPHRRDPTVVGTDLSKVMQTMGKDEGVAAPFAKPCIGSRVRM